MQLIYVPEAVGLEQTFEQTLLFALQGQIQPDM